MASKRKSKKIQIKPVTAARRRAQKKNKIERFTITSHKVRSEWFRDNTAWPMREANALVLVRERARTRRLSPPQPLASAWEPAGPSNIGGRMTAAVVHPGDPDVIWAGAAGGGIWHSTDAGQSWQPQWHQQDTLNVGSLAMDPNNPDIIYCGTRPTDRSRASGLASPSPWRWGRHGTQTGG